VIATDRPGIGLSEFQPNRTLLDWPPVIEELATHLGCQKFHVLGVSGGGPYVLVCARVLPDRLLSASVICGAPPLRESGASDLIWTYKLGLWARKNAQFLLPPGLAVAGALMGLRPDSFLVKTYARGLCERDRLAMSDRELFRIMAGSSRLSVGSGARGVSADGDIYASDWGIDRARIDFPIRYWHGGQDKNIPVSMIERFVKSIPGASLTVLADEGHHSLPMLCREEILSQILETHDYR